MAIDSAATDGAVQPAVIGSGFGGLATSLFLSRAGIDHYLLSSGPPAEVPRLGESINGEGTVDLLTSFAGYERFFFPKAGLVFHVGDMATYCSLNAARWKGIDRLLRLLGFPVFDKLLHVDRAGFDAALYEETVASPHCTEIRERVDGVEHDVERDLVTSLAMGGGRRLAPSFVFDATNHVRLLPRAMGLPGESIGRPQKVVYTHFHAVEGGSGNGGAAPGEGWRECTSLVVLDQERDGLSGMAWCIPVGSYLSVGASQDADHGQDDPPTVVTRTVEALHRRGIDIGAAFPRRGEISMLTSRWFVYQRSSGGNWLLVGGTAAQGWFTAGAGVGLSLSAAKLAPRVLRGERRAAQVYDRLVQELPGTHRLHDRIRRSAEEGLSVDGLQVLVDKLVQETFVRLCIYAQGAKGLRRWVAGGIEGLLRRRRVVVDYCQATRSEPELQKKWVHGVHHGEADRFILEELFEIISGQAPLDAAEPLLSPRVRIYMNGLLVCWGVRCWKNWVWYLRRVAVRRGSLRLEPLRLQRLGREWVATVRWALARGEDTEYSHEFTLRYTLVGHRIVEIRTRRSNYVLIHGGRMRNFFTFAGLIASVTYARLRHGKEEP